MKAHSHIPGSGRSLLTGVLVILSVAATLWAHSEPPPKPAPPKPIRIPLTSDQPEVTPLRWSWLHWWEVNRELYLNPAIQGMHRQDTDPTRLDALRAEASAALLTALDAEEIEPRASAALALGRIGSPAAEGVITKLGSVADKDVSEQVRLHAVLAIGMIGEQAGEDFLVAYQPESFRLRAAAVIAMGFLQYPSDETLNGLSTLLADPSPSIRAVAQWALSQHEGAIDEDTAIKRITAEPGPWLVSSYILALGHAAEERGVVLLSHILLNDEVVNTLPVQMLLESVAKAKVGPVSAAHYNRWIEAHQRLFIYAPTLPGDKPGERNATDALGGDNNQRSTKLRMVRGIEAIYESRLRSSAAIALGEVGDQPGVVESLLLLLEQRDDDYNLQPKCFALVSLGLIGSHEGLPALLEMLSDREERHQKTQKALESPLRGFAAIGLGLYARPYNSPQGSTGRPDYEKALELLQQRLTDEREKLEVRAACAIALGLAGRTVSLKTLIGGYESFDEASPLLGGYVLLARAMLGDRNLIDPVSSAIARKHDRDETTDLLARRAAVLALGVAGTGDVIPHLVRFWDEPSYVNREVILALSLCSAEGVSQYVLPGVNGKGNQYERAYMAEVVGRILSRGDRPPLSRFLIGSNFTMKHGLLEPYYAISNPFLYLYLIPQFEDTWY